jgi:hypothetical protein
MNYRVTFFVRAVKSLRVLKAVNPVGPRISVNILATIAVVWLTRLGHHPGCWVVPSNLDYNKS